MPGLLQPETTIFLDRNQFELYQSHNQIDNLVQLLLMWQIIGEQAISLNPK